MPAPVSARNTAKLRQIAEQNRTGYRPDQVGRADETDLLGSEPQHRAFLQSPRDRTRQRHFEPVEDPGDAECHNDERVEAGPRQAIEACRDIGLDDGSGVRHAEVTLATA
jgi:hypothetical protein